MNPTKVQLPPLPPAKVEVVNDPPKRDSTALRVVWLVALVFGCTYILNPTAGFFEFLPDNLPIIGNLDEAGAAALVIWAGRRLFYRSRS